MGVHGRADGILNLGGCIEGDCAGDICGYRYLVFGWQEMMASVYVASTRPIGHCLVRENGISPFSE